MSISNPLASSLFEENNTITAHPQGCGCAGCLSLCKASFLTSGADIATSGPNSLGAVGTLGEMAEFVRAGYWGGTQVSHNLGNTGLDNNNGVLHVNMSGYTSPINEFADPDGLRPERQAIVREALRLFEQGLGLQFVETNSSDTDLVDIFFRDNADLAYARNYTYDEDPSEIRFSVVNFSEEWSNGASSYNDYILLTVVHEIAHALGLGHLGPYQGTLPEYGVDNIFANDSWHVSVMSYFSQRSNPETGVSRALLHTPMAVDWMALNDIYSSQSFGNKQFGTSNAFVGDTTYGFNTNITSEESDTWAKFSIYGNQTAHTLVDGGGIDTLGNLWATSLERESKYEICSE